MKLISDLLRSKVVDAYGQDLGSVNDVRLVQDGPALEGFGAALRIDGLIVGAGALAEALAANGIDLIHENDARLVIPRISKQLPDEPCAFTNVLVHNCTGHHLQQCMILQSCPFCEAAYSPHWDY